MSEEQEKLDSKNNEEAVEETKEVEYSNLTEADYFELQKKNKQLFERAKKAEGLAKEAKTEKTEKPEETNKNGDFVTREEAKLMQKGYDDDDIEQMKRLAGEGKLADVLDDPLFKAYKEAKDETKKVEKAQIRSKGGGSVYTEKKLGKMPRDEHRDYFNKIINNA